MRLQVSILANSRLSGDIPARQWYQREVETFRAAGAEASLAPGVLHNVWPDVYVSWWVARSASAVLWSRLTGRKCVVVAGGTDSVLRCASLPGHPFFYDAKPAWVRLLTRLVLRWAHAVVAVSKSTVPDLQSLGATAPYVIYNCVDTELFRPGIDEPDQPRVITVCNMDRDAWKLKGVDLILEAFRFVLDTHPQTTLAIIGARGSGFPEVRALAGRLGVLDRIDFPGRIPNTTMAQHYQRGSVFVSASHYETFGVAIAEALACALPVVTSALPAVKEVAGDAAVTVERRDPHAFATAIRALLDDSALRRRLGCMGRARICSLFRIEARTAAIRQMLAELGVEMAGALDVAAGEGA